MFKFKWILLISAVLFANTAPARIIYSSGDWALDDSIPGTAQGTCRAYTAGYLNRTVYELSLVVDKTGAHPLESFITPRAAGTGVPGFQTAIDRTEIYTFANIGTTNEQHWNVPRNTDVFVHALKAANQIHFQALDGSGQLPLSLSGSSAVIHELEKRCAAGTLFSAAAFEKLFLPPEVLRLNAAGLTPAISNALRDTVTRAVAAYRDVTTIEQQMAALEAQFAVLTKERGDLQTAINQLINTDLPALVRGRDNAQATIDYAQSQITTLQNNLALRQADLAAAQASYNQAVANLQPYVPEHNRLRDQVTQAQRNLSGAQRTLANVEQNIDSTQRQIASLRNEQQSLDYQQADVQSRLRRARYDADAAERDYRNFDVSSEIRQRENRNNQLRDLENQAQVLQRQIDQLSMQIRQEQSAVQQAEQQLRLCQAQNNGTDGCATERARVENARQSLRQSENMIQNSRNDLNQVTNEAQRIHQQIQSEVYRERDALAYRAQSTAGEANRLEVQYRQIVTRQDQIRNNDLPAAQRQLTNLQNQRGGAIADVTNAQAGVNNATAALNNYDTSVGFAGLQAAVTSTAAHVTDLRAQISSLSAQIASFQRTVTEQTTTRDRLNVRITDTQALIAAKQTRLTEVDRQLVAYDQQKADIQTRLNAATAIVTQLSRDFAALIPL